MSLAPEPLPESPTDLPPTKPPVPPYSDPPGPSAPPGPAEPPVIPPGQPLIDPPAPEPPVVPDPDKPAIPPAAIAQLHSLLGLPRPPSAAAKSLATVAPVAPPTAANLAPELVARLRVALDGSERRVRDEVREWLQDERFRVPRATETTEYREQVLGFCRHLSGLSVLQPGYAEDTGRALRGFAAPFETIAYFDLSVTVKFGVQFGLFAGAIQNLGSARQRELLPEILRAELLGCFAMTERGHGSNVRDLQTRADYDADKHEFVIHTPSLAAGKEWIGGAAVHARMAVVFAQVQVAGEACGVHALLVPIRDLNGQLLPGVRAEDCGHKMGLNGVDNGRLWFDHVRVPHAALLDRFGQAGLRRSVWHSPTLSRPVGRSQLSGEFGAR